MKRVIIIIVALLTVSKVYSQNVSESVERKIEEAIKETKEMIKEIDSFERYLEERVKSRKQREKLRKQIEKLPEQRDSLYSIEEELSRRIDSLSCRILAESNDSIKEELKCVRNEEFELRSEVRKKLRKQRLESLQVQCIDSISGIFTITCEGFLKYTLEDSRHCTTIISGEFINGKAEIDARNLKQGIFNNYYLVLSDETVYMHQTISVYYGLKTGVEVINRAGEKHIRITIGKPKYKNL